MKNKYGEITKQFIVGKMKRNKISEIYVIWTAYNEEKYLEKSVKSVEDSIEFAIKNLKKNYKTCPKFKGVICHNGCTDKTPFIAKKFSIKNKNTFFPIEVIKSRKGMVKAQHKCINLLRKKRKNKCPALFVDADAFMDKKCLFLMIEQLIKHPKIKVVGAHPIPTPYKGLNYYKKFLDKALNFRAYYPTSEIAIKQSKKFHPYAEIDPQSIGIEFEKRSKIYFHGRCFLLKNYKVWDVDNNFGAEDIYLERSISHRFGKGQIRIIYHANVMFNPILSFKEYIKTYFRQYIFLDKVIKITPKYNWINKYVPTKMSMKFIHPLNPKKIFFYFSHKTIRNFVYFLYKINPFLISVDKIWKK